MSVAIMSEANMKGHRVFNKHIYLNSKRARPPSVRNDNKLDKVFPKYNIMLFLRTRRANICFGILYNNFSVIQ